MKSIIHQSLADRRNASMASPSVVTLVAFSVCMAAAAQPPTDTKITLDMCATVAFRKNNEKACNELEASTKPQLSTRGVNLSTVPTTSPNYGKAVKS